MRLSLHLDEAHEEALAERIDRAMEERKDAMAGASSAGWDRQRDMIRVERPSKAEYLAELLRQDLQEANLVSDDESGVEAADDA